MFVDDQEEEVEEEEEFHEVEEEKHKTSQESVGGASGSEKANSPIKSSSSTPSPADQSSTQPNTPLKTATAPTTPLQTSTVTSMHSQSQTVLSGSSAAPPPTATTDSNDNSEASGEKSENLVAPPPTATQGSASAESEVTTVNRVGNDGDLEKKSDEVIEASETVCADEASDANKNPIDWANIMLSTNSDTTELEGGADIAKESQATTEVVVEQAKTVEQTSEEPVIKEVEDETSEVGPNNAGETPLVASEPVVETKTTSDEVEAEKSNSEVVKAETESQSDGINSASVDKTDVVADDTAACVETTETKGDETDEVTNKLKELDLDEDVKNPQYIPKKGVFYEHDDRSHDVEEKKQISTTTKKEGEGEATENKESASGKKSVAQEKSNENRRGRRQRTEADRWDHDLFRDEKQKPKSKSELINAYGYDIRQNTARNHADNRTPRGNGNNSNDKPQGGQDNQRARQGRDTRRDGRQNQPPNRSRDRKPRRQNNTSNRNVNQRTDMMGGPPKRDGQNSRPEKLDTRDTKHELGDEKKAPQAPVSGSTFQQPNRRDHDPANRDRNVRNDSRGRRRTSRDRPTSNSVSDDRLPPINTVMPSITVWSNEDMAKADAISKESPSRNPVTNNSINNIPKGRADHWQQGQPNKNIYQDRSVRHSDENRHQQHYNPRSRYQDRDDSYKQGGQYMNRSHQTQHGGQEWRRTNHSGYTKAGEYDIIKTQTFENSRIAQTNMMNRQNNRDLREIINERRMQGQPHNFQSKMQPVSVGTEQSQMHHQRGQMGNMHHPLGQHQHQQMMHAQHQQHLMQQQQQTSQHRLQHQQSPSSQQQQQQQQQQQPQIHQQQPQHQQTLTNQQTSQQQQQSAPQTSQQIQNQRQQQAGSQAQAHSTQTRQNLVLNSMTDGVQESARLGTDISNANDMINSRPIVKTDAYTGTNVGPQAQQMPQQHSQSHRSMGGPMSQQGPNPAGSHLVPSHMNAGANQAQYYTPSGGARDSVAAAAAIAGAYHGYMPGGHSVMDSTRYHMTSQQMSDHGYMSSPGQTNDVAAASVLHQQGMYSDAASTGGTVASSAYLGQAASTLSPSSNIPVTGAAGPPPPLPPVSYLQHSQYPPPPYTNPYTQPQHNQAHPPQTNHPYPYWTYI